MALGRASGWLEWGDKRYEFQNAPAYAEKNWGGGFPKKWFWVQCDSFQSSQGEDVALTTIGEAHVSFLDIHSMRHVTGRQPATLSLPDFAASMPSQWDPMFDACEHELLLLRQRRWRNTQAVLRIDMLADCVALSCGQAFSRCALTDAGAIRGLLSLPVEEVVGLIGLHWRGRFLEFSPTTADVEWTVQPWGSWRIRADSADHRMSVEAECSNPGTPLRAPTADHGLAPLCKDSFYGRVSGPA